MAVVDGGMAYRNSQVMTLYGIVYKKENNFCALYFVRSIGPEPQLLLGTHTGDSEPNHLLICGVNLKKNDAHEGELHVLKRITHKGSTRHELIYLKIML